MHKLKWASILKAYSKKTACVQEVVQTFDYDHVIKMIKMSQPAMEDLMKVRMKQRNCFRKKLQVDPLTLVPGEKA